MTLALRDLQAAFAAHIVADDRADLTAMVVADSLPADARLRVYRHHVFYSLASALAETFPTVKALVGEAFFRKMAQSYVSRTLPTQPVLAEYGHDFSAFVAAHESARDLPYLADMARLDWALNCAFHADRPLALSVADLQSVGAERLPAQRLELQPGAVPIESAFPLDRIWTASQPGAAAGTVDLQASGVRLLVLRQAEDAIFVPLSTGEAALVGAVSAGQTLEEAAAHGLCADPGFDLSPAFARLVDLGAFAALRQP